VATSVVSPATSKVQRNNDVATNSSIPQNAEKSTPAVQESEENLSSTTENELLSDPADDEKSDREILAAALMSTAQKGFFT